jgi:hypothetical protein
MLRRARSSWWRGAPAQLWITLLPIDSSRAIGGADRVAVGVEATGAARPSILSFGESWHLHHADPTCARHGVGLGQIDISARIIAILERLGWAYDVRWPTPERLARVAASRDRRD